MIRCEWQGQEYNLDLSEYPMGELDALEQHTGDSWHYTWRQTLVLNPVSAKAPFWLTDRRTADKDVKWSDYVGPPLSIVVPHLGEILEAINLLGKMMSVVGDDSGSDDSPSTADSDPGNSTDSPEPTS